MIPRLSCCQAASQSQHLPSVATIFPDSKRDHAPHCVGLSTSPGVQTPGKGPIRRHIAQSNRPSSSGHLRGPVRSSRCAGKERFAAVRATRCDHPKRGSPIRQVARARLGPGSRLAQCPKSAARSTGRAGECSAHAGGERLVCHDARIALATSCFVADNTQSRPTTPTASRALACPGASAGAYNDEGTRGPP